MELSEPDFDFIVNFLAQNSGYHLTKDKLYLLETRLSDVAKKHNIESANNIISKLRNRAEKSLSEDVVEAMTVNETYFFRDKTPFDIFENDLLPILAKKGHIRIWSAACSTGQEPYSIAMILDKNKEKYPSLSYSMMASDINRTVVEKAKEGRYSDIEVGRGLPEGFLDQYFEKEEKGWAINSFLKRHIEFRTINLKYFLPLPQRFDLILLRNVLIYFDKPLKEKVLHQIGNQCAEGGYLMLGAAEGIYDPEHVFKRNSDLRHIYQRN